ncbi:hypothetical protein BS78_01G487300 [Paspalum vaginatum]|nr:hypothetical protein BS78_01G487300 [Paspalum vaginatum]
MEAERLSIALLSGSIQGRDRRRTREIAMETRRAAPRENLPDMTNMPARARRRRRRRTTCVYHAGSRFSPVVAASPAATDVKLVGVVNQRCPRKPTSGRANAAGSATTRLRIGTCVGDTDTFGTRSRQLPCWIWANL